MMGKWCNGQLHYSSFIRFVSRLKPGTKQTLHCVTSQSGDVPHLQRTMALLEVTQDIQNRSLPIRKFLSKQIVQILSFEYG